jgi:hypothetical protein
MNRMCFMILSACLFAAEVAAEETVRCGSKIVRVGMTSAEVLKYCGEPSSREVEEHDVRSGGRAVGTTQLHIWTYKRGTVGNPKVLEFDQDKLISIE